MGVTGAGNAFGLRRYVGSTPTTSTEHGTQAGHTLPGHTL